VRVMNNRKERSMTQRRKKTAGRQVSQLSPGAEPARDYELKSLELKMCEACGGLFARPVGTDMRYCSRSRCTPFSKALRDFYPI
jgi:hypothetical protein